MHLYATVCVCCYRAMHYSAERGIAIACRPSVRPSVRLCVTLLDQDHIGTSLEISETYYTEN